MSTDDEEMRLALELSKKSYEDEVRRRSLNEPDLISFESPDDLEFRGKVNKIKKLIYQTSLDNGQPPSVIGWRQEVTHTISSSSNGYPLALSSSLPSTFAFQHNQYQRPPPLPPKNFPPIPNVSQLSGAPPPLPPRLRPPSSYQQTQNRRSEQIYPILTVTQPNSASDTPISYPLLNLTPSAVETPTTGHSRRPSFNSSLYDYLDSALYVPHFLGSSRIMNGDLIDLGDADHGHSDCSQATLEQIRREFDPLFRVSPEKDAIAMPPEPTPRAEVQYSVPAIKSTPVSGKDDSDKENAVERWLTLEDIIFSPCIPDTVVQVEKLKERGRLKHSESSLFFQSPTADYSTTNIQSVKIVVLTDHTWNRRETVSMVVDPTTTVDVITVQAVSMLLSETDSLKSVALDEYGLKVFGLDEFLPSSSQLGHSVYVGKCLLHSKDVKLEIGKVVPSRSKPVEVPHAWDQMKSHVKYLSVLDREDVENVMVHLANAMAAYEKSFGSVNTLSISAASNKVRQCVKLLCEMLNSIEPCNLHQHLQAYLTATTEEQLKCSRNDFFATLHNFLYVYCRSTMSTTQVAPIKEEPTRVVEIPECTEKLKVMVNSLHNLPVDWLKEYSEFDISVNVYYGTRLMDTHSGSISKAPSYDAFFPCVPMNIYIVFNHLLALCPRETKIMFILHGISVSQQSNNEVNRTETKKCLAFGSVPLFDYNRLMRQGQLFVPLTILKEPVLKPWGPHPLIAKKNDPVVIVTLPAYDYQVLFPEVAVEYQSAKQDFFSLSTEVQSHLMDVIESGETQKLLPEDLEILWQKRSFLMDQPEALPLVLNSVADWGYGFLSNVYQILEEWVPLSPVQAMQLLLPQYPDVRIRSKAVEWIMSASTDFLFNALPQLVEALRFELFESSSLAIALLTLSYKDRRFAFEIYWQLQQRIDHCVDYSYAQRCTLLQKELLARHESDDLRSEIALQHKLLSDLDCLQMDLKMEENDSSRLSKLRSQLGVLDSHLLQQNVHLPILPSFKCSGVTVQECSIFNSNAKPLKIVFRGLSSNYSIIHKSGDDMRQDALVLQIVGLMNDIWLSEGLDLRVVTFRCMPVGFKKGMAELVSDCATLCDIQKEGGVTGVFKDDVLMNWIQKHNSSEFMYKVALDNFTRSCAAWCVATFILGIGDRHNDNILVTTTGHVFHIDFGKYMGDWQTAAGFKRDRVPFVFTAEMYHVINGGTEQRESYQNFIDYCCRAFNFIRKKHTVLSNILKIMACSDIAGVNMESLAFVEKNLMLDLSETDAVIQFTELINVSLRSAFPRINFFFHTLAQKMTSSGSSKGDQNMLSFVPQLFTKTDDGEIKHVRVLSYEKRMIPHKVYLYKTEVRRENQAVSTVVYRTFDEYNELYMKMRRRFPTIAFAPLNVGTRMRSNVAEVAQRRMFQIQQFLQQLFTMSPEISHCDLVYTFFHLILRDSNIDSYSNNDEQIENRSQCQVYLKIQHNSLKRQLSIFVGHVKHLSILSNGQSPDAYVKIYVRPDPQNMSKRKTQVVRASQNPTFNKELYYDLRLEDPDHMLATRVLEISVWNSGGLMDNHKMYMTYLPLQKLKNQTENRKGIRILEGWFTCDRNT